ncbi:MAG: carboxymuconolactone decarboxylase family protein [Chloroflexi bacterium]|nr:carboxymuconolactone decarboxylase family protein [Chloroflexota bacterium]
MGDGKVPEAWLQLPSEERVRAYMGSGHPYDFGFIPAMARLASAHQRIAPYFGTLFAQIMFAPGALTRREREMVAAVASAAQDCHY